MLLELDNGTSFPAFQDKKFIIIDKTNIIN